MSIKFAVGAIVCVCHSPPGIVSGMVSLGGVKTLNELWLPIKSLIVNGFDNGQERCERFGKLGASVTVILQSLRFMSHYWRIRIITVAAYLCLGLSYLMDLVAADMVSEVIKS